MVLNDDVQHLAEGEECRKRTAEDGEPADEKGDDSADLKRCG